MYAYAHVYLEHKINETPMNNVCICMRMYAIVIIGTYSPDHQCQKLNMLVWHILSSCIPLQG